MFNIINHLGNTNQNHNETPLHTTLMRIAIIKNKKKKKRKTKQKITSDGEDVAILEPLCTAGEMQNGVATVESSLVVYQKVKHRITI